MLQQHPKNEKSQLMSFVAEWLELPIVLSCYCLSSRTQHMNQGPLVSLSGFEFKAKEHCRVLMVLTLVNWLPSCQPAMKLLSFDSSSLLTSKCQTNKLRSTRLSWHWTSGLLSPEATTSPAMVEMTCNAFHLRVSTDLCMSLQEWKWIEMVGRTKQEITKSMELEVEFVHRQLTNSERTVKNGISSAIMCYSQCFKDVQSTEIDRNHEVFKTRVMRPSHLESEADTEEASGRVAARSRAACAATEGTCHFQSENRWKRMEENGREVKMVKNSTDCGKMMQNVRELYHALFRCLLCLIGQENLSCLSLLRQAALPASHPKCTCEFDDRLMSQRL